MNIFPFPTHRPTSGEYTVLALFVAILLIGLGGVALALGYFAPPEKQEAADQAMRYGAVAVGLGALIAVGYWLVRRFTRY